MLNNGWDIEYIICRNFANILFIKQESNKIILIYKASVMQKF